MTTNQILANKILAETRKTALKDNTKAPPEPKYQQQRYAHQINAQGQSNYQNQISYPTQNIFNYQNQSRTLSFKRVFQLTGKPFSYHILLGC